MHLAKPDILILVCVLYDEELLSILQGGHPALLLFMACSMACIVIKHGWSLGQHSEGVYQSCWLKVLKFQGFLEITLAKADAQRARLSYRITQCFHRSPKVSP